jgi:hypothetical protein
MNVLNHCYKVTHADDFTWTIIPNEAAHVWKLTLARLHKEQNLTLTFDGNSTHQSDSVYFVHVTTKNRESYFLNGYKGSEECHTAQWVKDKILFCITPLYHHNWLGPQFIDSGKCQWRSIFHDVLW